MVASDDDVGAENGGGGRAINDRDIIGRVESGSGGTSKEAGCRKVTLTNRKHNISHTQVLYKYITWTKWCWFRTQRWITVNTVKTGWDIDVEWGTVSWEGNVKTKKYFYEWSDGSDISGHYYYKKGHLKNEFGGVTFGHSYPENTIRAHSNGTWTWWTND